MNNERTKKFQKWILKITEGSSKSIKESTFKKVYECIKSALDVQYQKITSVKQFEDNFMKKSFQPSQISQKIIQQIYHFMTFNYSSEEEIKQAKKEIFDQINNKLNKGEKIYELYCKVCFPKVTSVRDDHLQEFKNYLREDIVKNIVKIKKEALKKSFIKSSEKSRTEKAYSKEELKNVGDMYNTILGKIYSDANVNFRKNFSGPFFDALKLLDSGSKDYIKKSDELLKKTRNDVFKEIKNVKSKMPSGVDENLKKLFKKSEEKIFSHYYVWYLNLKGENKDWKSSKKDFSVVSNDGKKEAKVEINVEPMSEILPNVKNISSMDRNNQNAINIWKNEVKSKDGQKVLFSAIRHGNTRGKMEATEQILLAAAVQEYGLEKLKKQPNKIWRVHLANVQLMTSASSKVKKLGENDLIFSQMEAFRKLAQKDKIDVKIDENNVVHLKLANPILFNFGMNNLHYNKLLPVNSMHSENLKSMEMLFGKTLPADESKNIFNKKKLSDVGDQWVSKLGGKVKNYIEKKLDKNVKKNEIDLIKIKNLSKQILYIWHTTNGHGIKENPTSIQTRLLALMNLIGYPVSFNCKSGKDRTGIVAAEVNNLVTSMEANGGEVPDPRDKVNTNERLNLIKSLEASNSEEISKYNTGYRGLKVGGKNFENRFGKVRGASGNAKS